MASKWAKSTSQKSKYTGIWLVDHRQVRALIDLQINLLICKRLNTGEEEKEQTHRKLKSFGWKSVSWKTLSFSSVP